MPAEAATGARMTIAGDPASVRAGLCALMAAPPLAGLPSDLRQDAELVLAEVLNNIAEHAYAAGPGPIEVQLLPDRGGFACIVRDRGTAMPGGTLPAGLPPSPDGPNPPEGGFGWHLIRSLVQDLSYVRDAAGNKLTFRISRC